MFFMIQPLNKKKTFNKYWRDFNYNPVLINDIFPNDVKELLDIARTEYNKYINESITESNIDAETKKFFDNFFNKYRNKIQEYIKRIHHHLKKLLNNYKIVEKINYQVQVKNTRELKTNINLQIQTYRNRKDSMEQNWRNIW